MQRLKFHLWWFDLSCYSRKIAENNIFEKWLNFDKILITESCFFNEIETISQDPNRKKLLFMDLMNEKYISVDII